MITMNLREIITDAIRYPIVDIRKFLIFCVLIILMSLSTIIPSYGVNNGTLNIILTLVYDGNKKTAYSMSKVQFKHIIKQYEQMLKNNNNSTNKDIYSKNEMINQRIVQAKALHTSFSTDDNISDNNNDSNSNNISLHDLASSIKQQLSAQKIAQQKSMSKPVSKTIQKVSNKPLTLKDKVKAMKEGIISTKNDNISSQNKNQLQQRLHF